MSIIANIIATIVTRTLANRRIEQAKARLIKAQEQASFEGELIAALEAHVQTLPEESTGIRAEVGDTVTFNFGRTPHVRQEQGIIQAVDGSRYRVLVGTGMNQEFKTVFAGQVTEVRVPADALGLE